MASTKYSICYMSEQTVMLTDERCYVSAGWTLYCGFSWFLTNQWDSLGIVWTSVFELPVSVRHQSQTPIVPCYFSQEGEHNQQSLKVQNKQWPSRRLNTNIYNFYLFIVCYSTTVSLQWGMLGCESTDCTVFLSIIKNILLEVLYVNSDGCKRNTEIEGLVLVQIQQL